MYDTFSFLCHAILEYLTELRLISLITLVPRFSFGRFAENNSFCTFRKYLMKVTMTLYIDRPGRIFPL